MQLKVPLTPKIFPRKLTFATALSTVAKKFLALFFFLQMMYPLKARTLGAFLPGTTVEENGSSLVCDVISVFHLAQTEREIVFFCYRMPDSCIVFGCNNKSDSENGRALHRIPFSDDPRPM